MPANPHLDPQRTTDVPPTPDSPSAADATGGYHPAPETEPFTPQPAGDWPSIPGYAVTGEIARGGMGRVLAGRELTLDREVAIKVLLPGADAARFVTESKITAKLPHPNIPPVYALGTLADGSPFLAMKFVRGETLANQLDERPDPKAELPRFVQIFEQIAQAVGFAHAQGIIHRDLKPANVMVGEFGEVQVMDWGLARSSAPHSPGGRGVGGEGDSVSANPEHTRAGAVMGTPAYMAPEQARGEPADARADVFALGGILTAVLTGKAVFTGDSAARTVRRAAAGDTADALARLHACGADAELVAVATACLQVERDGRPVDGRAVATLVAAYRHGVEQRLRDAETARAGAVVREAEQRKRRRLLAWSAAAVVAVLAAGVVGTAIGLVQAENRRVEADTARAREKDRADGEEQAKIAERAAKEGAEKAFAKTLASLDTMVSEVAGESLATQPEITPEQKAFLVEVLPLYREFAKETAGDEKTRARTAKAAGRVGLIERRLGRKEEGVAAFRMAGDGYRTLAADFPAVPAYRNNLATTLDDLGNLLADLGRKAEAEEQHRNALDIRQRLAADFPAVPGYRGNLAASHNNLGNLLAGLGRKADAEGQYKNGLAIQERLVADFPTVPAYRNDLASSHNGLANLLAALGKRAEAEGQHMKGLAIREKLVADFPAVPAYRQQLAKSRNNLGVLLANLDKRAEAEGEYREGLAIQEKLVADFPAVPAYRQELATSHNNLGVLLAGLGKRAEAEGRYKKAIDIRQGLVADFPAIPAYRSDLAASHNNLGVLLTDLDKRTEAEEQYKTGLAIQEGLAIDFPAVPAYRNDLAHSHTNLGLLLAGLGKRAEAEGQYREGLALREKLVADFPAVPAYRQDLADSHTYLGVLFTGLGKRAEAEEQHRRGLAVREELVADFPAVPEYRVNLGGSCCNFGALMRNGGKPADSLAWFRKAIDTLLPVHEKQPEGVRAKLFLSNSYWGRALAHDLLAKHADAVKDWDRAVELSEVSKHPILRVSRAASKLRAGQVAEAVAEAAELAEVAGSPGAMLYDLARVYAVASDKVADARQEYADRAMELLHKAVRIGYKNATRIEQDKDLDPIRGRDDFKKLLADLEAKFPPPREAAPPPRPASEKSP